MNSCTKRLMHGFTLIELMIGVAIVGILAAIALPSYNQSVRKAHRVDAMRDIMELSAAQERFYAQNNSYSKKIGDEDGLNFGREKTVDEQYELTSVAGATGSIATSYKLTATALDKQLKDHNCKSFSLSKLGIKTSTDADNNVSKNCW